MCPNTTDGRYPGGWPLRLCAAAAILLTAALAGGCAADSPDHAEPAVVHDSAGITIVENSAAAWTAATAWRLDPDPALAIGDADRGTAYRIARAGHATRLADGTIVIAELRSRELRFFDAAGVHLRSVGGRGNDPGEFAGIRFVGRYGTDSLVVWDAALRRGSVFGNGGGFARVFPGPDLRGAVLLGHFGDGFFLGRVEPRISRAFTRNEVRRRYATYFRFGTDGSIDTIADLFAREEFVSASARTQIAMPFGRGAVQAGEGEVLHHGSSDTFEIRTYSLDGSLLRILRYDRPNPPLPRREFQALLDQLRDVNPDAARVYAEVPPPETLPASARLIVDTERNLWVGDYPLRSEPVRHWTVFDPDGRLLGNLETPRRFAVYEIGADYLLGRFRGNADGEKVLLYRLVKQEPR